MAGELHASTPSESAAVSGSEIAVAGHDRGNGRVALLLTIAAVVAAIIGWRASVVSNQANDSWQSTLHTTEKRAAGAMNDIQSLYQRELPMAVGILQSRILAEQLSAAAPGQSPGVVQALTIEAGVQQQMSQALGSVELSADSYSLPSGGFDLGKRLADLRSSSPELMNLDPDGLEATGDQLAHKAVLLTYALLPASIGALLGVLAQPLRRYRMVLLTGGSAAVAAGAIVALAVEVLA